MRAVCSAVVAVVVCGAAAASAGAAHDRSICTPGMSGTVRTFCGPAKATAKVGGKTLSWSSGTCSATSSYFAINIGQLELGSAHPTKPYFGISVGRFPGSNLPPAGADGTYKNAIIGFHSGSTRVAARGTVTLTNGRTKGTFTGTQMVVGGTVSGSFSC